MRIFLVLIIFISFDNSASFNISSEIVLLSHDNADEYGLIVKNKYGEASKICTTITINKYRNKAETNGMYIVVRSSQGQHVFSSKMMPFSNKNSELIDYHYCYQSYDVVSNVITYADINGHVTANLEFSSELIVP